MTIFADEGAGSAMEWFIHQQNVSLYRRLLTETEDEARRQILRRLLAEELAKEAEPLAHGLRPQNTVRRP